MSKIIFFTWLFVLTIISCNSEHKKYKETNTIIEKSKASNHISLTEFSEKFGGVWLPEQYVNEIRKSKSAYLARNSIPEISELIIHNRNFKNDTLFVGSSLNNHEGYGVDIWETELKENCTYANNIFDWTKEKFFHFTYDLTNKTISIICENLKGELESKVDYIKVLEPEYISNFGGIGYEIISRECIINGKYQILDSLKRDLGIVDFLAKSGEITNFRFGHYTITTDFNGAHYPSDYILLRLNPNQYSGQECLSIINKNDTILLYDNIEIITDTTYDIELKNIKYYLIK